MLKGLLEKELIVLIKNNKMQLLFILMFVILGVFLKNAMYIVMIPVLIPMQIKQGISWDELSKWDKYTCCLPVEKKTVVSAKYIMILLSAVFSVVLVTAAFLLMRLFGGASESLVPYFGLAFGESLLLPALMLPFDFKFGSTKGRMVYFILTGVIICVGGSIALTQGSEMLTKLSDPSAIMLIFAAVSAVLFGVSWVLSAKIYEAREI